MSLLLQTHPYKDINQDRSLKVDDALSYIRYRLFLIVVIIIFLDEALFCVCRKQQVAVDTVTTSNDHFSSRSLLIVAVK